MTGQFKVEWLYEDEDGEQAMGTCYHFASFQAAHAWAYGADGPDCYWLQIVPQVSQPIDGDF